jgi:hypothetical protein
MSIFLNFGRDVQGYNAYAPQLSKDMYSAAIASGASQSITVPSNFTNWIAVFSFQPGSDIWVSVNHTATPPAGATFASTNSMLLPAQLSVQAGNTISCFNNSGSGQDVGIALYAIS